MTGLPDNVDVRELDIRDLELEPDFDLAHCRAVLMHLPDPADTLGRIVAALRPGGVLLAEEGDFVLLHFGGHPNSAAQNNAHQQILNAMHEARIMDGYLGRKLPDMLVAHGLELQFAEIDAGTGRFGEPEYEWLRTTLLEVTAKLVPAGVIDAATRRVVQEFLSASGTVVTSVSLVAAGGTQAELTCCGESEHASLGVPAGPPLTIGSNRNSERHRRDGPFVRSLAATAARQTRDKRNPCLKSILRMAKPDPQRHAPPFWRAAERSSRQTVSRRCHGRLVGARHC